VGRRENSGERWRLRGRRAIIIFFAGAVLFKPFRDARKIKEDRTACGRDKGFKSIIGCTRVFSSENIEPVVPPYDKIFS
jgi:hypothetical protein